MNRRLVTAAIVVLLLTSLPRAAVSQTVSPDSAGFSNERLERVTRLMQARIDQGWFPGAVALVARDDAIVHFEATGLMDVETDRAMRTDAQFRIMSMTKPVVAFSIMLLVEEGKVRLTDPVSRFVPELGGLAVALPGNGEGAAGDPATVPAARDITIRDLLTHTSGLMSGGASAAFEVGIGPEDSLADVIPRLGDIPLDFEPGARWAYSGQFGFDVLARVVEIASGIPFAQFAEERIFVPLGMNDTGFAPTDDAARLATLYQRAGTTLEQTPDLPFVNGRYFSGGGGLFSTAEDYLRFARMLLGGGDLDGTTLASPKTVNLMTSAFVPGSLPGRTPGEGYGLGVRVVTDRAQRATLLSDGSYGWSGAFNTHFFVDPVERVIGIFMTQSAFLETRQQLRDDFETAVMQALLDTHR